MTANCPECEATLTLAGDIEQGEIVQCPNCGAELQVTAVNPAVLELTPEVDEEWGE